MEKEIKQMVRLVNADVLGTVPLYNALRKVKGVSFSFANALCSVLKLDRNKKIGELSDENLEKLEDAMKNPGKYGISAWMLNRRKDYETGEDQHLVSTDLALSIDSDLKRLKKIKSYRGMRHAVGLPVRGQRTKAHFRRGKTIGVQRSKTAKKGK